MLGWLRKMTFSDGTIPLLNDSSPGIAPNSQALLEYADRLGLHGTDQPIKECGYRTWQRGQTELVLDVGPVGPDYIPGHAHSDTFSFVLYHKGRPVIVDPGTSTYEKNDRRQMERSTCYHNTVMVHEREQSEVWGGFRVGRRAKITELEEKPGTLRAVHDGYVRWGISHERTWKFDEDKLMINDRLKGAKSSDKAAAFFHFGPDVKVTQKNGYLEAGNLKIRFAGANDIQLESYEFCMGFNKRAPAQKISIRFSNQLETTIEI